MLFMVDAPQLDKPFFIVVALQRWRGVRRVGPVVLRRPQTTFASTPTHCESNAVSSAMDTIQVSTIMTQSFATSHGTSLYIHTSFLVLVATTVLGYQHAVASSFLLLRLASPWEAAVCGRIVLLVHVIGGP